MLEDVLVARYGAEDGYLLLQGTREVIDLLDGVVRHDTAPVVRLGRWLGTCGYDEEAD